VRAVRFIRGWWLDLLLLAVAGIVFVVPFIFIVLTAAKDRTEAALLEFTPPSEWLLIGNILEVLDTRNGIVVRAMLNSVILTVGSVALIVLLSAMVGFVLQRRRDRTGSAVIALMLACLVIPPAIVPTIFVLQSLGIFKTLFGLILVEVAFTMPFAILIRHDEASAAGDVHGPGGRRTIGRFQPVPRCDPDDVADAIANLEMLE
jgi:raffinose/stachyose/melibiose transport system permease protein